MTQIVIVGSGLAGHTAAAEIRDRAPDAKLTVVGSEIGLPYDRPPLSKEYLLNGAADRPTLSKSHVYGNGIELLQEVSVVEIDRTRRSVQLSNGESRDYDRLLLATGSRPRHLPDSPADSRRVHYLRTLSDANGLRSALEVARTIVIIGGGFVGLEVAAAARSRNCEVVVFERATRLLSRSASVPLSRFAQATHEAKGNKVILGAVITRIIEENEEVRIVWNGGTLHADLAVIGIGVVPNVELAAQCGLTVDDGIVVDSHCRTSDPEVFAAGEVTNYPIVGLGTRIRSESWSVSHAQAAVAARNMLGEDLEFTEMPWLWSDQYDHNIQCLGLLGKADRYYRINDPSSSRWLLLGISRDDRIVGAEALNMGREMSALRRAVRRDEPAPREIMKEAIPYREMDEEK